MHVCTTLCIYLKSPFQRTQQITIQGGKFVVEYRLYAATCTCFKACCNRAIGVLRGLGTRLCNRCIREGLGRAIIKNLADSISNQADSTFQAVSINVGLIFVCRPLFFPPIRLFIVKSVFCWENVRKIP
jgi:hypothetical protein